MTALATLTDVAAVAQAVPTADQSRVTRLIEIVSARVQRYTGQTITAVAGDVVTITPHDGELRLPQRPVTAVASVVIGGTTIDATLYEAKANGVLKRRAPTAAGVDSQFGFLASGWPVNGEWPWPPLATTVTYSHGYATVPDDLAGVVAEVVASRWLGGSRRAEGKTGENIDGYGESWATPRAAMESAWEPEHKDILDSYRRAGFASVRIG